MHNHGTRAGGQRFGMPFKKNNNNNNNFKMSTGSGYNPMNISQIPGGYMDFSDPTPPLPQNNRNVANKPGPQQQTGTRNSQRNKRSGGKNRQARNNSNNNNNNTNNNNNNNNTNNNNNNTYNNRNNNNNNNTNNKNRAKGNWQRNKFIGPVAPNNGGVPRGGGGPAGPLNRVRGIPQMGGRGRLMPSMPPLLPPHGFRNPPLIPPISPMGRGPLPPPMGLQQLPPPFIRRNARGRPIPIAPPIPPMLPPVGRMTRSGGNPPMSFNGGGGAGGKIKKLNAKAVKKVVKSKNTIKTLKNIVNQYPLNKPWVTDEIREEHAKKIDIENRLIGNKDDDLFAQFKVQRDKFVGLYEAARENHLKTEAANAKLKDAKKQEKVNQTTEPDANCSNQEAITSN